MMQEHRLIGPTPTGDKHEFNELKHKIATLVNAQKNTLRQYCQMLKINHEGDVKEGGFNLKEPIDFNLK